MNIQLQETLAKFSEKLGFLLGSGVPLVPAMETLMAELGDDPFIETLRLVVRRICEGKTFHESLGEVPRVFSPSYVGMVRSAEHQGILDTMMGKIAQGIRDGLIPVGGQAPAREDYPNPEAEAEADRLLTEAVTRKASDLHIFPIREGLLASFRIDGRLVEARRYPAALKSLLIARFKIMAHLDLGEQQLPQDGRMLLKIQGRNVDVRVNLLPTVLGEKISMQLLCQDDVRWRPEDIFPESEDRRAFLDMIGAAFGLVVICGPSGSGKTSTAYCALQTLKEKGVGAIDTIESPVAMIIEGIAQTAVRPWIGMDFSTILNAVDRSDPDVIYVGDVPDAVVLAKLVKLALTGHLVIVNLHASSIEDAFGRLLSLEIPPHLLASAISGVSVQRLVRKVCPECGRNIKLAAADLKALGKSAGPLKAREGKGCQACNQSGYRGRIAIYEFFHPDKAFKDCLQTGDRDQIRKFLAEGKRRSLAEAGARLVATGKTTLSEVQRVLRS